MRLKHKCKRENERLIQQRIRNILKDIINIHIKREVKGSGCKSESLGFLASWSVRKKRLVFVALRRRMRRSSWCAATPHWSSAAPPAELWRKHKNQSRNTSLYFCEEERRNPTDRWWSRPSPSAAPCASPPGCPAVRQSCFQCWGKLLSNVMHCNIALLPKKVTNYVTFMEWNALNHCFWVTF